MAVKLCLFSAFIAWLFLDGVSSQKIISLDYSIEEETGPGELVGNTARDSGLFQSTGSDFVLLSFEPFAEGNKFVEYMSVDESTGVIRTAKNIDREKICQRDVTCKLQLDIAVYKRPRVSSDSLDLINVLRVVVIVRDINDNNPTFPSRVVTLFVPENEAINYVMYSSVATDADAVGANSSIVYRFDRPSRIFELSTAKTAAGLEDLVITVKKVLDRETQRMYPLTVVATDLGDSPRSGSVLINVQVTDVNDNAPVFGNANYTVIIPENSDIQEPVVVVSASDKDEGSNAKLKYQLSNQVSRDIKNTFSIEEETGKIFARTNLDYETQSQYQFYVKASDDGNPSQETFSYVTVKVLDQNDNAPQITINQAPGSNTITEHGSVGKFLAHIKVSDADSGVNGEVSCSIPDSHFRLEPFRDPSLGIYKIILRKELDREDAAKRNVTVECRDGDAYPLSATASFELTIKDINDHRPAFIDNSLYGTVMENDDTNAFVVQVIATDLDAGENADISYKITSVKDAYLFTIDKRSGSIRTTTSLDREVKEMYVLEITVHDNGETPLTNSANVTIKVLDENDNPPKFTKQAFFNDIAENLPIGSPAGDVSASDADSRENGRFAYSIVNHGAGSKDGRKFRIDPDSGVITSRVELDREDQSSYTFRVKVSDPSVPNYYDVVNVTIAVLDDNDHAPFIIKPEARSRSFVLPFNTTIGTVITVVEAMDGDDTGMVEFNFDIHHRDPDPASPLFSIDANTGKLRLARPIRPDDVAPHRLQIKVSDGTSPGSRSTVFQIAVDVEAGTPEEMRGAGGDDTVNKLIIIVIIIVTFVIAIITLVVICLIRRVDKKRRPHPPAENSAPMDTKLYQAAQWVSSVSIPREMGPDDAGIRVTVEAPNEKKKKKEVSFSLDDDVVESPDTSGSIGSVFAPSPNSTQKVHGVRPFHHAQEDGGFIVVNGISSPDFSHHLYDPKSSSTDPTDERQYMEVNRQGEDRYSDASSGDTGTSDSGRGGSEDESHAHTSSSADGDHRHKIIGGGSLSSSGVSSFVCKETDQHPPRRYPQPHKQMLPLQSQVYPDHSDSEDIPGSPTPMLSDNNRHCYIRGSLDKLPSRGLGSLQSSPSASTSYLNYSNPRAKGGGGVIPTNGNTLPTHGGVNNNSSALPTHGGVNSNSSTLPTHGSARLTLSMNDCEGPYRVKKAEQHQQLLKTFSSPRSSNTNVHQTPNHQSPNSHPAWRKAKGLDTSWRSASSMCREDDDNTTTSGSYTINPDDLREDNMVFPDIMV